MIEVIYALVAFGVFIRKFRKDSELDPMKCFVTALFWPVIIGSVIADIRIG